MYQAFYREFSRIDSSAGVGIAIGIPRARAPQARKILAPPFRAGLVLDMTVSPVGTVPCNWKHPVSERRRRRKTEMTRWVAQSCMRIEGGDTDAKLSLANESRETDNRVIGRGESRMKPFRFEHEMSASALRWLQQDGFVTKSEFSTPWGICDFVGVDIDLERAAYRLQLRQRSAIGPMIRVDLLARIPDENSGKSVSLSRLSSLYRDHLTRDQIEQELQALLSGRFITSDVRYKHVQKINGWMPLHRRIVALELKLSRVDEALNQAMSHLAFATHSYVGLPADSAARVLRADNGERFRKTGIGLISVDRSRCRRVIDAQEQRTVGSPVIQMHVVERFWRNFVKDNSA